MEFAQDDLADDQWELIEPIIPKPKVRPDGRGRPWKHPRSVLNGILWVLRNGTPWRRLPKCYPSYQTCHRRFQQWVRDGTFEKILSHLSGHLAQQKKIDESETFVDATFAAAKKGGSGVGLMKRGKGTKIMVIADANGLPLAACMASASRGEATLVEETLDSSFCAWRYKRLIGDKAYDSDPLDKRLKKDRDIDLIAPHRRNRTRRRTQDGRPLRRYRRRWKVERLFAWLQNYRRLVTRFERYAENFQGFVQLGCMLILMRHL